MKEVSIDEWSLFNMVDEISIKYFNKPFRHDVRFNNRLRTTGGRYIPSKRLIELNPKYLKEMVISEFIGIIKHELCHYHLHISGKGYKHGDQTFKDLLKLTNSPRFCRPLPSNQKQITYIYICEDCRQTYNRKRRMNIAKYRCGKCNGQLSKKVET